MNKQKLYHHTHNVTGRKYLGQTTRDMNVYKGSSDGWREHLNEYGIDLTSEVLFESKNTEKFKEVCKYYSNKFDVVDNPDYFNKVAEHGGSLGGAANPNYKTGKYTGRLDNPELYKEIDRQNYKKNWVVRSPGLWTAAHCRMNFLHHKRTHNRETAEYWWKKWYDRAPKKSNNRQSLWSTDTFKMWYSREGNDLNFR